MAVRRCDWAEGSDLDRAYHDEEWGVPEHSDLRLFELLTLEGAQAGLSWSIILRKRAHYRVVFQDFEPARVARFDETDILRLLGDAGIVRHRGKIESTINNACRVLEVRREFGSLDAYLWGFVDGVPRQPTRRAMADLPTASDVSRAMSRDLLRRGFRFVGPTTCYAFMQAVGMVNDHLEHCFRHAAVARMASGRR